MKKFKSSHIASNLATFSSEDLARIVLSVVKLRTDSEVLKGIETSLVKNLDKLEKTRSAPSSDDQQEMF